MKMKIPREARPVITALVTLLITSTLLLTGCGEKKDLPPLRIAIIQWPGFEFLHLADKKGFFKEEGLSVQLVQFSALEDERLAYESGQVEGIVGTPIELLVAHESGHPSKIALLTDFSNGADVIIARKEINNIAALKGKKVGIEPPFGAYVLSLGLQKSGLSLDDVTVVNMNQLKVSAALLSGEVDAVQTYAPYSTEILRHADQAQQIFNSGQIPGDILSLIALNPDIVANRPEAVLALRRAWQKAYEYAQKHTAEANKIMAEVEGVTPAEFAEELKGDKILNMDEQRELEKKGMLERDIANVNAVLKKLGQVKKDVPPAEFIINMDDASEKSGN